MIPYSFTPDDQAVLFSAARQDPAVNRLFPTGSQPELYRVPVAGDTHLSRFFQLEGKSLADFQGFIAPRWPRAEITNL